MSQRNPIPLLGRMAGTVGRVSLDSLGARLGWTLPLNTAQIARPGTLGGLLAKHGIGARVPVVSSVRRTGVRSLSSNCNNFVIEVECAERGEFPERVFVKLPSSEPWTRVFCNLLGIWRNECHFYRHVAPLVPIRVPQAYLAATRGAHFVLALENLHDADDVRLFTNSDMIAGVGADCARACLSAFATLHAAFADYSPNERERLLPLALHPFHSPQARTLNPFLSRVSINACHRKEPELFPEDMVSLYRKALARWDDLMAYWFREPLTLIHGDSHLGNFFVSGTQMGMLDWQAVQWAQGIRDVQYFLINSMPEDLLAAHEQELIDHYVTELARRGVTLRPEEAWAQYRALSFQTLMTSVVSIGTASMTDMDDVLRVILARSVAAVRRVGFGAWLARYDD